MKYLFGLLAAFLFSATTIAADVEPDVLVKNVTTEVLDVVRKDKDIQNGNSKKTLELVETKILPHFNFQRMIQLAMGREGRKATPEQLKTLTDEFRNLLVRTYSKALTEFRNQEITYKPLKMAATDTDVRVRTEIKQSGGKPVSLDYYLEKSPAGWKVYDVEVGGASLITNYRTTFGQEIQNNGVEGLIRTLQAKNKTGDASGQAK